MRPHQLSGTSEDCEQNEPGLGKRHHASGNGGRRRPGRDPHYPGMKASQKIHGFPACIVDDDRDKQGRFIDGVVVAGTRDDIPQLVRKRVLTPYMWRCPQRRWMILKTFWAYARKQDVRLSICPASIS